MKKSLLLLAGLLLPVGLAAEPVKFNLPPPPLPAALSPVSAAPLAPEANPIPPLPPHLAAAISPDEWRRVNEFVALFNRDPVMRKAIAESQDISRRHLQLTNEMKAYQAAQFADDPEADALDKKLRGAIAEANKTAAAKRYAAGNPPPVAPPAPLR